jgi:hypothetical protein
VKFHQNVKENWDGIPPCKGFFGNFFGNFFLSKHWSPRVANWLPKFVGILFFYALGPIQGHKVQHFISNLGQIEFFFSISA